MVIVYSLATMLGAFLLFLIQPMVAKTALPTLGGAPYVWNGCMLFFQAVLLMGYLYAHLSCRLLSVRRQSLLHLALITLGVFVFPLQFNGPAGIDPAHNPISWLILMLAYSVGLPFFIISASAPLLQKWFAGTNHKDAHNPYFLYAASNTGSMLALISYPFVVEPNFSVPEQAHIMMVGYYALFTLFVAAAFILLKSVVVAPAAVKVAAEINGNAPTNKDRLQWIALSAVPSSLLYGVTTYITTDIASVPLLWIVPLVLYLLTFILLFANKPRGLAACKELHVPLVALLIFIICFNANNFTSLMLLHLAAFFVATMACHGLLVERRPASTHLTEFYLWMSFGGVLGGLFNTMIAPHIFTSVAEYPLALVASCLLRAGMRDIKADFARDGKRFGIILAVSVAVYYGLSLLVASLVQTQGAHNYSMMVSRFIALGVAVQVFLLYKYRKQNFATFAVCIAVMAFAVPQLLNRMNDYTLLYTERNFFGVNRVIYNEALNANLYAHGTTNHGMQSRNEALRLHPVSYYTSLKQVVDLIPASAKKEPMAVLGLGVGTISCYGTKGQMADLFEIDPAVERIARDETLFTYMRDCPPDKKVYLGDARLKLAEVEDGRYGFMVMDAFTSDAIPVHLLTDEAVQVYMSKLADKGLIAFNISNRHIELKNVISAILSKHGWAGASRIELGNQISKDNLRIDSEWVVVARTKDELAQLLEQPGWKLLPEGNPANIWTDNYSNIVRNIKAFQK